MSIKISIVIPTFKRPHLVIRCLNALRLQSFLNEHFEVIIVTDGPDPVTLKEVDSFLNQHSFNNVLCTSLAHKAGPAAARNKGAGMAKGELIAFTDDDCLPGSHWLKAFWKAYNENLKGEIAFTGKTIVPRNEKPTDYEKNIANLETAEFITANCACTKTAFKKTGGFDEDFPIAWREDSEFHFKFIAACIPIIRIDEAVVVHPVRTAPWGISLKEQKKSRYNALLRKKHPLLYKEKIGARPLWNYYGIVLLLPVSVGFFLSHRPLIAAVFGSMWLLLFTQFVLKRLHGTSKTTRHVIEMIVTSLFIPILSVFWTLYGSFRYKKLLL